ncbi:amino acid ABC transporter substrate-binding protein, partial [Methylobacterium sp. J-030]|nr:amino acid ABC transporter substrate-binding protein [Methylobacterium sp. J-030]
EMSRARADPDLHDNPSRQFTPTLVLADARNRAGSTDGAKLRAARAATDIRGPRTIIPGEEGVFDVHRHDHARRPVRLQYLDPEVIAWVGDLASDGRSSWP